MPSTTRTDGRTGRLGLVVLAACGAVLVGLFTLADVSVAEDGTLTEPFWLLGLGTLALTGAGVVGLVLAFRGVRRRSVCGRGGC